MSASISRDDVVATVACGLIGAMLGLLLAVVSSEVRHPSVSFSPPAAILTHRYEVITDPATGTQHWRHSYVDANGVAHHPSDLPADEYPVPAPSSLTPPIGLVLGFAVGCTLAAAGGYVTRSDRIAAWLGGRGGIGPELRSSVECGR